MRSQPVCKNKQNCCGNSVPRPRASIIQKITIYEHGNNKHLSTNIQKNVQYQERQKYKPRPDRCQNQHYSKDNYTGKNHINHYLCLP